MKIEIVRKLGSVSVIVTDKGSPKDLPVELASGPEKVTVVKVGVDDTVPPLELIMPPGFTCAGTIELEPAGASKYTPLTSTTTPRAPGGSGGGVGSGIP